MAAVPVIWDVVAYHAQQAGEKYLKGYLVNRGEVVPRIHDLAVLLTRCSVHDRTLAELGPDAERLSRLGWLARYPCAPEDQTEEDVRAGVEIARRIRSAIRQRMRQPPRSDAPSNE